MYDDDDDYENVFYDRIHATMMRICDDYNDDDENENV